MGDAHDGPRTTAGDGVMGASSKDVVTHAADSIATTAAALCMIGANQLMRGDPRNGKVYLESGANLLQLLGQVIGMAPATTLVNAKSLELGSWTQDLMVTREKAAVVAEAERILNTR